MKQRKEREEINGNYIHGYIRLFFKNFHAAHVLYLTTSM
jgi:hypothetical protein